MRFKTIALIFFGAGINFQPVLADDMSDLKAQLQAMQQQMQKMQAKLDVQELALKEQKQVSTELKHQQAAREKDQAVRNVAHEVADSISMGGVIEVVASQTNSDAWSGDDASDIVLDTFELVIEASANEWVSGSLLFLYEDDDNDHLNVDEAFITIANQEVTPFYLTAGRLYVPFGHFETNMISDPVTLTLAETREDVVQLGFETDGFYGSAYLFNGDVDEAKTAYSAADDNQIDNYGLNFGYAMESDNFSLDVGAGYINNIATSETLTEAVDETALCGGDACVKDYIGGMSLHAIANVGQFYLIAEYVSALDEFEAGEISTVNADKLKPQAWSLEAAYNFNISGKEAIVALGYQKSKDMYLDDSTSDFFEQAWLASLSLDIAANTRVMAEWRHAEAYNEVKDLHGNGFDDEDLLQLKLLYEF